VLQSPFPLSGTLWLQTPGYCSRVVRISYLSAALPVQAQCSAKSTTRHAASRSDICIRLLLAATLHVLAIPGIWRQVAATQSHNISVTAPPAARDLCVISFVLCHCASLHCTACTCAAAAAAGAQIILSKIGDSWLGCMQVWVEVLA
jgi:hypothetical protein